MLYKFFGAESGMIAVELLNFVYNDNTLRASAPTSFNDPFEFKVAFDFDATGDVIRRRYFEGKPTDSETDYGKWRMEFTDNFKWRLSQETRRKLMSAYGVICFTTIEDNQVLWSHYAAEHKGFCVGFDESITQDLPGVVWHAPVVYQCDVPIFRYYYDSQDTFTKDTFGYKSDRWAYEGEYRVVVDRQGVVQFPKIALREVMLGCRAYAELRNYAETRLDTVGVVFFQMVEDFGAYSLTKKPIQRNVRLMSSHS